MRNMSDDVIHSRVRDVVYAILIAVLEGDTLLAKKARIDVIECVANLEVTVSKNTPKCIRYILHSNG